ncbi:MAG TPA: ATP-binding protein [Ktedonobacteraceae bacterium]|nr:ATP-binding protein [Ktedonobacteraceae bacterium]
MEHLTKTLNKARKGFGFATPEEAVWTCETCGEVQPRFLSSINRYMRGTCACERARIEQEREQERLARYKAMEAENRRYTYGWLGSRWSDEDLAAKTFANFDVLKQPRAYEAVMAFADIMKGTLVLYGPYGTGKTHMLAALCQEMKSREVRTRFTTSPKLFAAIQFCIGHDEDYTNLIQKAIQTPLLVIDDVDKAKWTEFREEIYFEIIDSRVNADKPIALSTNRLDDLEKYVGGACKSRLQIGQIAVEMTGDDYRKEL